MPSIDFGRAEFGLWRLRIPRMFGNRLASRAGTRPDDAL